nr:precorrin-6y C5,15-methyltransferase (decarboxylating) subunit CbiE [Conexibacter sp. SYSU D00693]
MAEVDVTVLGVHGGALPADGGGCLAAATVVAGGAAVLEALAPEGARRIVLRAPLEDALDELLAADGPRVVLASGDPGFFGIVRALRERGATLDVRPAPSSVAVAFGRVGLSWDDALVVSAHGRAPEPALHAALRHPKVAVLTEPRTPPSWFAQRLAGTGRRLAVASRLGEPDERVVLGAPEELTDVAADEPNVLLSWDPDAPSPKRAVPPAAAGPGAWALPDDAFEQRGRMVTKREVRALALARLGPGTGDLLWDVGCHSASVAVEAARLGAAAIGIERDAEVLELARRNAAAHGVPVRLVHGAAPGALADLPDPDVVFVGGGGADLPAILDATLPRVRRAVVVTLALLDRATPALEQLSAGGFAADGTLLQASRLAPLAGGHRLAAENPVVVLTGVRR